MVVSVWILCMGEIDLERVEHLFICKLYPVVGMVVPVSILSMSEYILDGWSNSSLASSTLSGNGSTC